MAKKVDTNIENQFYQILEEYKTTLDKNIEKCLTDIGEELIQSLELNSPVDLNNISEKHFKDCWKMKTKYRGVRYIGNTKTVHDGIPLSNLIEHGSKGNPFIEKTFNANKERLFSEFVKKLKK